MGALVLLCSLIVLPPAIARAQFAASARMSVADILAALVGQPVSADSYTATTTVGPGHSCSSQLASCVDLGPGSCNFLGTDASGRIRLADSGCVPEVWIGDETTKLQPGNITVANGAISVDNSIMRNNVSGALTVDDPDGLKVTTQVATPSCAAGSAGTFSTLASSGAAYYCNGTAAQKIGTTVSWSGSLNFVAFGNQVCQDLTFAASGAVKDEAVVLGGCGSVFNGDLDLTCEASIIANGTADVRLCCIDATGCADLAAITFTITAVR